MAFEHIKVTAIPAEGMDHARITYKIDMDRGGNPNMGNIILEYHLGDERTKPSVDVILQKPPRSEGGYKLVVPVNNLLGRMLDGAKSNANTSVSNATATSVPNMSPSRFAKMLLALATDKQDTPALLTQEEAKFLLETHYRNSLKPPPELGAKAATAKEVKIFDELHPQEACIGFSLSKDYLGAFGVEAIQEIVVPNASADKPEGPEYRTYVTLHNSKMQRVQDTAKAQAIKIDKKMFDGEHPNSKTILVHADASKTVDILQEAGIYIFPPVLEGIKTKALVRSGAPVRGVAAPGTEADATKGAGYKLT